MNRASYLYAVVLPLILLTAVPAAAVERQHHVGVDPMLAILVIDDKSTTSTGPGVNLHYSYGLTDQFNFMAEVGWAAVARDQGQDTPSTPRTRPADIGQVGVGFGYVIDIIQWVPYVCVLGTGYRLSGGTLDEAKGVVGAELGIGLDYQASRHFTVGIGGRQHLLATELSTYPSYTTAFLRLEYTWGF